MPRGHLGHHVVGYRVYEVGRDLGGTLLRKRLIIDAPLRRMKPGSIDNSVRPVFSYLDKDRTRFKLRNYLRGRLSRRLVVRVEHNLRCADFP